jgi:hypothetical protein
MTDSAPESGLERYDAELLRLIAERGEQARRLGPTGGELGVLLLRLARTPCGMNPPVDLSR